MVAFARALLTLAACCLGESRREWALAMQREFHSAVEDGRPLGFAIGCLIAAWREMPSQAQGRFTLANHALALGLLLPMAVLQLKCVAGLPYLSLGEPGLYAMLAAGSPQEVVLGHAYHSAIPALLTLWLLLGAGHLRLAWLLLERDWAGAAKTAALTVAASATLLIFTVVLFLDDTAAGAQAMLLAIELGAIYALAQWHARAFPNGSTASFVS